MLLNKDDIHKILVDNYNISGKLKYLFGELDLNYHVVTDEGKNYLLKISSESAKERDLDFQVQLLAFLQNKNLGFATPTLIKNKEEKYFGTIVDRQGKIRFVRLQNWLKGTLIDKINPWDSHIMCIWGKMCGTLSRCLAEFDHPAAHRNYAWDPDQCLDSRKFLNYIQNEEQQSLAKHFWNRFEKYVQPVVKGLRKSVNYNDAHEQNILLSTIGEVQVSGVIDFGDAVYTSTINELAIACAYALMRSADPMRSAFDLVKSYHETFPILEEEVSLLYDLIAARLLISVSHAARNAALNPDNSYLQVSQKPAWELLENWQKISPAFAHYYFRYACGWEPCFVRAEFDLNVKMEKPDFYPVMSLDSRKVMPVDLSVSSLELGHFTQVETLDQFEKWMNRYKEDNEVEIMYGGYLEPRNFYSTDHYTEMGLYGPQWRSIHAGLDLWSDGREAIYAVHSGEIKYVKNNTGRRNYGPTIILEHEFDNGLKFYSLYGHLSSDSLNIHNEGDEINGGDLIGYVGNSDENGEWPPHLHFQIMLDLLDLEGDFPGVVYPHEQDIWASICPNPAQLIGLDYDKVENKKLILESLIEKRTSVLGKNLSLSYKMPLHIVRGQMQYLMEYTGRKYLDTVNNVAHVGHEHPAVVKAISKQTAVLNTNTRYLHKNILLLAEQLITKLPKELEVIYFVNSGSEANELAVRLCENWSGSKDMLVLASGYHGNSGRCVELSSYKFDGKGGKGASEFTHVVNLPDTFRGIYKDGETAGKDYAYEIKKVIEKLNQIDRRLAGFITESIVSCGGQVVLPKNYLKLAFEMVREAGGLCVADEVQTGLGRVGTHFWAFELHDVVPDIVTIGKPLGNGYPIAAVACKRAVAEAFDNGMEYFNTFGGNPVSCAAGSAVMDVVVQENLMLDAAVKGEYWKSSLRNMQKEFPIIGDVRGHGLFLGFELVRNETLEPATEQTTYLINRMRQFGLLLSSDGPYHNVIKIKPPLCITRANIDLFLEHLELVLREDSMRV